MDEVPNVRRSGRKVNAGIASGTIRSRKGCFVEKYALHKNSSNRRKDQQDCEQSGI